MIDPTLYDSNPWWISIDKINNDNKIIEWNNSKIRWDPRIRKKFNYEMDIVYSLRGPRQVGKTTMVKIQINEFLKKNVNAWNIMYHSCDMLKNSIDLVRIITNYFDETEIFRDTTKRSFIFLDEISKIKNWQSAIKNLRDRGIIKNCTIVVTGSHTLDLKKSSEKLPGRRGETNDPYDKIFLPMKFSEYVALLDSDLKEIIQDNFNTEARTEIFTNLLNHHIDNYEIDNKLNKMKLYLNKLNKYLDDYLVTGGIPYVIDIFLKKGYIDQFVYTQYVNTILSEIKDFVNIDDKKLKQLLDVLVKSISWPLSWTTIQKEAEIGNSTTVEKYVDLLGNMFFLTTFYKYNPKNNRPRFKEPKKIRFHDPFFFHAINSLINTGDPFRVSQSYLDDETNRGLLVEGVIGDHLIRLAFHLIQNKQLFDYIYNIFYWKDKKQKEVDYILYTTNNKVPIEVKFTNRGISSRDIDGLINFKKINKVENAILITKDRLENTGSFLKIPASMFLLII